MSEEIIDLVDDHDQIIGQACRSDVVGREWNLRAINVFIVNGSGELFIPCRTAKKRSFPLCLDMSCGGYVMTGESYEDALHRELREELDMDFDDFDCREIGYLFPNIDDTSMFMKVYEILSDNTPELNPADFVSAEWMAPEVLLARIDAGVGAKDDLPLLVRKFYASADSDIRRGL